MSFPVEVTHETMKEIISNRRSASGQYYCPYDGAYFAYSKLSGNPKGKPCETLGDCKGWLKEMKEADERENERIVGSENQN